MNSIMSLLNEINGQELQQQIMEALNECMECEICCRLMVPPIVQCKIGHSMCNVQRNCKNALRAKKHCQLA